MNQLDKDYQDLVRDIMENGRHKGDRTGTGTISVFDRHIKHNMADGFPLLTTKKMSLKNIKTELYWFLKGDTNIKFLVERGCNIWNGDAYKYYLKQFEIDINEEWLSMYTKGYYDEECSDLDKGTKYYKRGAINRFLEGNGPKPDFYLTQKEFVEKIKSDDEFAKRWGELGPIYGAQWRDWDGKDQIAELIHNLQHNPDSRRLMVNAWNVGKLDEMTLPPCHYGFQCYTEELTLSERITLLRKEDVPEYTDDVNELLDSKNIPKRRLFLKWNQRSVDTGLGLPYNIASYGLLLLMLADEVNMVPHILSGTLGDTHLYQNHVDKILPQLDREPLPLPKVHVRDGIYSHCDNDDIILIDYESHPPIKLPLSN